MGLFYFIIGNGGTYSITVTSSVYFKLHHFHKLRKRYSIARDVFVGILKGMYMPATCIINSKYPVTRINQSVGCSLCVGIIKYINKFSCGQINPYLNNQIIDKLNIIFCYYIDIVTGSYNTCRKNYRVYTSHLEISSILFFRDTNPSHSQ